MQWHEPWVAIDDLDWPAMRKADYSRQWETQVRREAGQGHVLFGEDITLVARRFDTDDALFRLADGRYAEVHLTWRQGEENDPLWPATALFRSLKAWAASSTA